jgi:amino-acid N-acetyltransferase
MSVVIRAGRSEDLPAVRRLLAQEKLPLDGVDGLLQLIVAATQPDELIVGSAAFEEYASGVLLRSVVVDEQYRRERLGQRLITEALDLASRRGHRAGYLLTTTAANFFPRFGFTPIDRADVPADVRQSIEFTSACPESATVMWAELHSPR